MARIILIIILYTISNIASLAQVVSEEIVIKNNAVELPGTLSYTQKNSPLLIWIHGSGNVDRNGNQEPLVKANYIQQFREACNNHDLAFFSYDKRTANPANKEHIQNTLFDDFVLDAKKVVSYFKNNTQFSSIVLLGHSQGSLVAMLAAKNTNKYISIAGASTPIDAVITAQVKQKAPFLESTLTAHFKELKETDTITKVNPMLMSVFAPQNHAFLSSWMHYNPSDEIKKITLPALIINGTKDLQIPINNAKALHASNTKAKLVIIENMNHVLKNIQNDTDNQNSYFSPDYPLSEKLVNTIVNFAKQ